MLRSLVVAVAVAAAAAALQPPLAAAQDTVAQPAASIRDDAPPAPEPPPAEAPPPPSATATPRSYEKLGASRPPEPAMAPAPAKATTAQEPRLPSYSARAVAPAPPGGLREEERIGDYAQPRWTARRRFPTTRTYVRPAGTLGVEAWLQQELSLEDPDQARYLSLYEFGFGLGHRMQVDVYLQTEQQGHHGALELASEKLEWRWALARWGSLFLNPTVYLELQRRHGAAPKVEVKALLGDELARRVHFGVNLVFEHVLGDALDNEYNVSTGVSYTLVDSQLALGAEVKLETSDVSGRRLTFDDWQALAGPSLQWTPTPPLQLLLVALFGSQAAGSNDTPIFQPTLVLGYEI